MEEGVRFDEDTKPGHDRGDTDDLEVDEADRHIREESQWLFLAVKRKDGNAVKVLLDNGANLGVKNQYGQTALHLAVENCDTPTTLLFLERGADPEIAAKDGSKPLFVAAGSGNVELIEVLLAFNADVESFNVETEHTALHRAVENGHMAVAKFLLEKGADIDVRTSNGHTPLLTAVIRGYLELVELLLQHGANKKARLENGKTAEDFAVGDNAMVDLLRADYLLQGPSITNLRPDQPARVAQVTFLPPDQTNKLNACHGFEASITDFFLGDREQRIQVSSSIYEILYGTGPEAIMASAKGEKLDGQKPRFRWYHLPANNLEWVEILVNRIFAEQQPGGGTFDAELKSKLALTNSAGRQFRAPTTHSSFMRPLCRAIKPVSNTFLGPSKPDQTMLFIPYLHFENYRGYQRMSRTITDVKIGPEPERVERSRRRPPARSRPTNPSPRRSSVERESVVVTEGAFGASDNESSDFDIRERPSRKGILRGPRNLKSTFRDLRKKMGPVASRAVENEPVVSLPRTKDGLEIIGGPLAESNNTSSPGPNQGAGENATQPDAPRQENASLEDTAMIELSTRPDNEDGDKAENPQDQPATGSGAVEGARIPGSSSRPGHEMAAEQEEVTPIDKQLESIVKGLENMPIPTGSVASGQSEIGIAGEDRVNVPTPGAASKAEDGTQQTIPISKQGKKSKPPKPRVRWENLDEDLIRGYLLPPKPGEAPPLQLRRTLDQYFYTHLASTSDRDNDQVVYRYTKRNPEPKMFMVDQLWLWIINEDTVISCCPQRWDVLSGGQSYANDRREPPRDSGVIPLPPPRPPLVLEDYPDPLRRRDSSLTNIRDPDRTFIRDTFIQRKKRDASHQTQARSKSRSKSTKTSGLPDWLFGSSRSKTKTSRKEYSEKETEYEVPFRDDRPSSAEERKRRSALLQADPLNVHQAILKYLQGSARPPVTSVYDMATLITDTCVNIFDQYQVPDDFQFFDFFERSIGIVIDREAQCFQQYARSLTAARYGPADSQEFFSIRTETELLVEIRDIRDELGILQMVLVDQLKTLGEFSRVVAQGNGSEFDTMSTRDENSLFTHNKVLESHLYRIEKMDKLAEKTYQSLNHLLDLKQKQANVSEALSARKQAENTSRQAELSAQHAAEGVVQAELAREQAEATAQQGRTVLVFTVVTIIFLPLSFLSAFFAINIDQFPWDKDDKLPMDYVMKYMFSISGAVSIPFVLVAFNQDRIAAWLKNHGKTSALWAVILTLSTILLAVLWTRDIASGINAAVTVTLVLLIVVGAFVQLLYTFWFKRYLKSSDSSISYDSNSSYSSSRSSLR